ncbi:MAG: hypothetical protein WAX04_03340 [Oscillospiraceae bacterium]
MVNILKNILGIKLSTSANRFIYYFKRIWLIGKILPDSVYADRGLKGVISWLVAIIIQSYKFLTKALYIGLAMFLPLLMIYEGDILKKGLPGFIHIFFIMSVLFGAFQESEIFKVSNEKFICLKYMRMNPKSYVQATVALKYLLNFIYFFPSIIISVMLLGGGFFKALLLCVIMTAFRFIFEAFHLIVYDKLKVIIPRKYVIVWIVMALTLVGAYLPVFTNIPLYTMDVIFSLPFVLATLAAGGFCFHYVMFGYKNYMTILTRTLDMKLVPANIMKEAKKSQFNDVKINDKDSKLSYKLDKYSTKTGYSYLNAIFFNRHKRQIIKPILIRLCIVALAFLTFVTGFIIRPIMFKEVAVAITTMLPIFVFGMYCMATGNKACRTMFYNCDISLLRYGFYRNPKVIIKNFKTRLVWVAGCDLLVGATVSLAVVLIAKVAGVNWDIKSMLLFVVTILLLSVFFTVHHLFMYYVFQPYTTELNVKNPFFNIINGIVYVVCYVCLQIKSGTGTFTLIVLCSTVVYIIVALLLVFKFSSKTFRVK